MQPTLPGSSTDRSSSSSTNLFDTSRYGWFELSWPTLGFCALIICVFAATQSPGQISWGAINRIRSYLTLGPAKVESSRVLVITRNPAYRLSIVATLSPRGLEPLLAENLQQVQAALAAHGREVTLAVLDQGLPDARRISLALGRTVPAKRTILVQASSAPETVGRLILEQL
jgi:hypothetical protein